jgi:mono/diheme cytochrome c family protein
MFGALLFLIGNAVVLSAPADDEFPPEVIKRGEQTYVINCSRCHGVRLINPIGYTFDLRRFPPDERERFFNSVAKGKGNMPAWGDLLMDEQVQALWAYVQTESRKNQ